MHHLQNIEQWQKGLQFGALGVNVASNEHDEFLELIEAHRKLLLKVCWTYTFNVQDRDDLLQEILARLWSAFAKYDRDRRFSTWMYRVALNVAIDFCRRKGRNKEWRSLKNIEEVPAPSLSDKQEQLQELHELLNEQSEDDRAILLLHMEGQSHREIGEVLGISESNVGTRMSRIKGSLRKSAQSKHEEKKR